MSPLTIEAAAIVVGALLLLAAVAYGLGRGPARQTRAMRAALDTSRGA